MSVALNTSSIPFQWILKSRSRPPADSHLRTGFGAEIAALDVRSDNGGYFLLVRGAVPRIPSNRMATNAFRFVVKGWEKNPAACGLAHATNLRNLSRRGYHHSSRPVTNASRAPSPFLAVSSSIARRAFPCSMLRVPKKPFGCGLGSSTPRLRIKRRSSAGK